MTPRLPITVAGRALRLAAGLAVLAALTGGVVVAAGPGMRDDVPAPAAPPASEAVPAVPVVPVVPPSAQAAPATQAAPVVRTPSAAPVEAVLTDDASIRGGAHARTRLGADVDLDAKRGSADYARAVLLRFDLDGVELGEGDTAVLRLAEPSMPEQQLELRRTATDWTEDAVTWRTRPQQVGKPRRATLRTDAAGRWGEVDVTAFVRAARAGGLDALALQITPVERTRPVVRFGARERGDGDLAPQLQVRPGG